VAKFVEMYPLVFLTFLRESNKDVLHGTRSEPSSEAGRLIPNLPPSNLDFRSSLSCLQPAALDEEAARKSLWHSSAAMQGREPALNIKYVNLRESF
jgi:hypothetical protein